MSQYTQHIRQAASLLLLLPALAAGQESAGEWRHYHRDLASTRYSPLDQINRANVATLVPAWTWGWAGSRPCLHN